TGEFHLILKYLQNGFTRLCAFFASPFHWTLASPVIHFHQNLHLLCRQYYLNLANPMELIVLELVLVVQWFHWQWHFLQSVIYQLLQFQQTPFTRTCTFCRSIS